MKKLGESMNIGEIIKRERIKKKMTLEQLGGDKYNKSHLSKIENGKTTPSYETLIYISQQLNVNLSMFFDEIDNEWTREIIQKIDRNLEKLYIPEDLFDEVFQNINKLSYIKSSIRLLYILSNHFTILNEDEKLEKVKDKIKEILSFINDDEINLESIILSSNIYFSSKKYLEAYNFLKSIERNYSEEIQLYDSCKDIFLLQKLVALINLSYEDKFFSTYKKIYFHSIQTENFKNYTRATVMLMSYFKLKKDEKAYYYYFKELKEINKWIPKIEYELELLLDYYVDKEINLNLNGVYRYKKALNLIETSNIPSNYKQILSLKYYYSQQEYRLVIDNAEDNLIPKQLMFCVVDRASYFRKMLFLPLSYWMLGEENKASRAYDKLYHEIKDIKDHPIIKEIIQTYIKEYASSH